jgi:regulator of protease activity HflC (stomatin/prohibitin superfamily)
MSGLASFLGVVVALVSIVLISNGFKKISVSVGAVGLLYRGGKYRRNVAPGGHYFFALFTDVDVALIPLTDVVLPQRSLTLITSDQFSFRADFTMVARVVDPRTYHESRSTSGQVGHFGLVLATPRLDAEFAAALVQHAGRRTLEQWIAAPGEGLDALRTDLANTAPGLAIERVLVVQVTVPPEVRKMFTEVERARREGLAQLERARSEQASLRALANAARALQSNPQLAQLRLLQAMEGAKGSKTFVLGPSTLGADLPSADVAPAANNAD